MKLSIIKISFAIAMLLLSFGLFAQNPPHPNGGNGPGSGNTPVGGGAPLGGGLFILMLMGAAYGYKKQINETTKQINKI